MQWAWVREITWAHSPHQDRQEIIKRTILKTQQSVQLKHQDLCLAEKNEENRGRELWEKKNQETGLVCLNYVTVQYSLATANIVKTQIFSLVKTIPLSRKPMLEVFQVGSCETNWKNWLFFPLQNCLHQDRELFVCNPVSWFTGSEKLSKFV